MKSLQITEKKARELYPNAPQEFKTELESHFGKEIFIPKTEQKYFEAVGGVKDACKILKITKTKLDRIMIANPKDDDERASNAYEEIKLIIKAINFLIKFVPNYAEVNQKKWWPWFKWDTSKSAFVFSNAYCFYDGTSTDVGVRLVLADSEAAEYVGRKFLPTFNKFLK